jgi:hypothetical protein
MEKFEFANNKGGFSKRYKKALILNLSISTFIFFVVTSTNDWKWGAVIAMIFFLVQVLKSKRWDNIFIDRIAFDKDTFSVNYTEQNSQIKLDGNLGDFILKKEIAFNRTKTSYLAIYHCGTLKLKQFEIGDWTEAKIDNVIESVNRIKITTTN